MATRKIINQRPQKNVSAVPENELERVQLQGKQALEQYRKDCELLDITLDEDYGFKAMDREALSRMNTAIFSMMGGLPAAAVWAQQNPNLFYKIFFNQNNVNPQNIQINGQNIQVITEFAESPLDQVQLSDLGEIIDVEAKDPEAE